MAQVDVLAADGKNNPAQGTPRESLIDKNPAELDAGASKVTLWRISEPWA